MDKIPQLKDRDWQNGFKIHNPTMCSLQETHFRFNNTNRLKIYIYIKIYITQTATKRTLEWLY